MTAIDFVWRYRLSTVVLAATAFANLWIYLGRALP